MNNFVTISKYGKNPKGNKSNNNSSSISLDNYVNNLKTFTRKEPDKVLNIIDNKTATDVVAVKSLNIQQVSTNEQQPTKFISLDNYVNNLKTFTRKEPDKVLNIPEIREKLFAGVNTINVSTQNLANPPIQEDGFASEQNILELFVTEIDEKILIPE